MFSYVSGLEFEGIEPVEMHSTLVTGVLPSKAKPLFLQERKKTKQTKSKDVYN